MRSYRALVRPQQEQYAEVARGGAAYRELDEARELLGLGRWLQGACAWPAAAARSERDRLELLRQELDDAIGVFGGPRPLLRPVSAGSRPPAGGGVQAPRTPIEVLMAAGCTAGARGPVAKKRPRTKPFDSDYVVVGARSNRVARPNLVGGGGRGLARPPRLQGRHLLPWEGAAGRAQRGLQGLLALSDGM